MNVFSKTGVSNLVIQHAFDYMCSHFVNLELSCFLFALFSELGFRPGLPDFSWYNMQKQGKYTK
jgi:hypothetical protein